MKLNFLKIIALTVSSGLLISSIPTKAESLKTNHEVLNKNSLNNTLVATSFDTSVYPVIEQAIVRNSAAYLKLKLATPGKAVSGAVIINSPSASNEYFIKDAKISKKE